MNRRDPSTALRPPFHLRFARDDRGGASDELKPFQLAAWLNLAREPLGEATEGGAFVHGVEADVEEAIAARMLGGGAEGVVELLFRLDEEGAARAEEGGELVILPHE